MKDKLNPMCTPTRANLANYHSLTDRLIELQNHAINVVQCKN